MPPKDLTSVSAPTGFVPASWQRVATYLHLQALVAGRDVVEAWSAAPDPRGWQTLAQRGARKITVVAPVDATGGQGVVRLVGDARQTGLRSASCEVLIALEVAAKDVAAVVAEARRVLVGDGALVLGVVSRDRPGATDGASYYDVVDACAAFPHVRMLGVAPFAGTTLVEYGVKDPEPLLDGTLVERGERVAHYVAVAGPERRDDFGYGVVQVPLDAVALPIARVVSSEHVRNDAARSEPRADEQVAELRAAIERHRVEMRAREIELAERDAYIKELELVGRGAHELEGRVARAEREREVVEAREREARKRLAEVEGSGRAGAPAATVDSAAVEVLRKKLADAESETWKHMRARSEAEATATALREDNQRKLKDARKLASAELMRATEEAMKKSVSLRDDLERSERLRKEAIAELAAHRSGGAELAKVKQALEAMTRAMHAEQTRAIGEVEAVRTQSQRVVHAMELELADLRRSRVSPRSEHDAERDRALQEQAEELARLRAEVMQRDSGVERAAAAAAHERARAERFVADERQAVAERNDARAKAAESAARVAGVMAEHERALASLEKERMRAEKAESELAERRERVRELKRELELHRKRATHGIARGRALEAVRARVHALETAVLGEVSRIQSIESSLRAS